MTRYALLIGINEYVDNKFKKLGAPVREAEKFGELLKTYGDFNIITPPCKDFNGIRTEILNFCNNKEQEDILLFYFSGHGKLIGKKEHTRKFHFITNETIYSNPRLKSISAQFVRDSLEDSNTKAQIVILDCCHSEAYISKGDHIATTINEELNASKGLFFLASSLSWETSFENTDKKLNERKSFFTEILIEGIEEGNADTGTKGIITFNMLKNYIIDNITKKTSEQTPVGDTKSRGYLELVRNPKFSKSGKLNCWVKDDFDEKERCEFQVDYAKNHIEKGNYKVAIQQLNEARMICIKKTFDITLIEEIDNILEDLNDQMPEEELSRSNNFDILKLTHNNLENEKKIKIILRELKKRLQNEVKNKKLNEAIKTDAMIKDILGVPNEISEKFQEVLYPNIEYKSISSKFSRPKSPNEKIILFNLVKNFSLDQLFKSKFERDYKLTVGVDIFTQEIEIDPFYYIFSFWNIGLQEKFSFIRTTFYKRAIAAVIILEINDSSLSKSKILISELRNFIIETPIILFNIDKSFNNKPYYLEFQKWCKKTGVILKELDLSKKENVTPFLLTICKNLSDNSKY